MLSTEDEWTTEEEIQVEFVSLKFLGRSLLKFSSLLMCMNSNSSFNYDFFVYSYF